MPMVLRTIEQEYVSVRAKTIPLELETGSGVQ